MSQIHYQYINVTLKEDVNRIKPNGHIFIAECTQEYEVFYEKTFSAKTHFRKNQESKYTEFVHKYKIIEIIYSPSLNKGDYIWTWNEPNYSLYDVKKYHKSGFSRSPIIQEREPNYPINGNQIILFIINTDKKNKNHSEIYKIITSEGIEAKKEILKILNKKRFFNFW